jgi:hypothetical protein
LHGKKKDDLEAKSEHAKVALAMYYDLIKCEEEEIPLTLMKFYTKECFLYKDVNSALRQAKNLSEE